MKLMLSIFLFFIFSVDLYSQISDAEQYKYEFKYIVWKQQFPTMNCQPSFFWSVTRSQYPNNYGNYYYKMYFQSNSKYCNGLLANTYMNGVLVFVNGQQINQIKCWMNFREIYHPPFFDFWAPPNPVINFSWDYITVN